ncbi:MAG: DNA-binding protein [Bifidobacterium criceti]|nr:DNA-binding protein [Bifidobacterium criceti]
MIDVTQDQVPLHERLAWTLPEAAKVFGLSYDGLREAANDGRLITTRPRSRRGARSWRHVTREEMTHYLQTYEI